MKMRIFYTLFLFVPFVFTECQSGKKQLQRGDYDQAVILSVKRLKQNPDSRKAKETLPKAYDFAKEQHLTTINLNLKSTDPLRWDIIVDQYEKMNRLYDVLNSCPACKTLVPSPLFFQKELQDAKLEATRYHYSQGIKYMDKNEMMASRSAYRHFQQAKGYSPQYDLIDEWLRRSREAGTLKVLVLEIPMHSRTFALSNEFFSNKIMEFTRSLNLEFVAFYSYAEIDKYKIEPNEEVFMRFDDFVVGQTYVKETIENLTKDSVKIGDVDTKEGRKPVYGTVSAKFHTFTKTVQSSGLLDVQIIESQSRTSIQQQKFPGTYIWTTQWAFFNGDERALNKEQIRISRLREMPPPPPQDLFIEFTVPIYDQVTNFMRKYYIQKSNLQ